MTPTIEKYERILKADPRSRIFVELARALLDAGHPSRAADVCRAGVAHHPGSVQGRVAWGRALLALGDADAAFSRFDEAIAVDPASPYAYDLVGEALVRAGHCARAARILERGAAAHPGDARIRGWLDEARSALPPPPPLLAPTLVEPDAVEDLGAGDAVAAGEGGPLTAAAAVPLPPPERHASSPAAVERGPEPAAVALDAGAAARLLELIPAAPPGTGAPSCQAPDGRDAAAPGRAEPRTRGVPAASQAGAGAEPQQLAAAPTAVDPGARSRPSDGPHEPPAALAAASGPAEDPDEAAATYEHTLRQELLATPPAGPGFLRRHALAAALLAVAAAALAGVSTFLAARQHRGEAELREAAEAARKGLARDTVGSLREAARVLDGARAGPAAAVAAEANGLLAHDHGDARARALAAELVGSGAAGDGALAARWLVADGPARDEAAAALTAGDPRATPLARALAGELLLARGDLDRARAELQAAATASPPLVRALAALGDLELARGEPERALERYELALRAHATHPHAALGAAEARLQLGRDLPFALRSLEAIAADPLSAPRRDDGARLELALARLLAAAGRGAEAATHLARAGALAPGRPELAAAEAEVRARAGDLEAALRSAELAARLAPGAPAYRELVARLQLSRGRYRELLAATEAAPTRTLRLYRGVARLALGEPDRSMAELEATRREGKVPAEAAGWMALAELARGRRAQAAAIVGALLAAPIPHPLAILARGRLDLAEGRPAEAERRFREACDRDPDLTEARRDLGRVLLARGRAAEAREVLDKAVARDPYHLDARLELGRAELALGDAAAAARQLEAVVAERPRDPAALGALAAARLGTGDAVAARRAADRAIEADPEQAASWLVAGKAAAADRDPRAARRYLARAAALAGRQQERDEARRTLAALGAGHR